MRLTQPLRWHGGKYYLAPKIVAMMPPHIHYVEPFAGGLAVLLAKNPEGVSEVVNDLDGELVNFWRVLQRPESFELLKRRLDATPFAREEFEDAGEAVLDPIDRAARFFVRIRQSLAARGEDFSALSRTRTRRGMNDQASAWLGAIEGLPAIHERMKRVVVENIDACELIRREDTPDTLFYCDPPYLPETRASPDVYAHEMTREQHHELLNALLNVKGKFILSGYRSELYDTFADLAGWKRRDFDIANHAAGGEKKRRMTECVWFNFEVV